MKIPSRHNRLPEGVSPLMRLQTRNRRQGFTAVEIAMVASIIAILALLIIPIFRDRAENARFVAAQDELASMAKALILVEADMPGGGWLVQLSDLDQPSIEPGDSLAGVDGGFEPGYPPRIRWVRDGGPSGEGAFEEIAFGNPEYNQVLSNWQGPYVAFPRGGADGGAEKMIPLTSVATQFPEVTNEATSGNQGPILVPATGDYEFDLYPLDPWGTPYLLFGPAETLYNSRVIYSLGPNGLPGDGSIFTPAAYNRRSGILGLGDDLIYEF